MTPRPGLIYDVGVCNGDDSAYYLHKGYKVIGVEANPLMLEPIRRRFHSEISAGRYHLVAAGIAPTPGQAPFWVCDDNPDWSSFDRRIASRNGSRHHCVVVPTCRFGSLLEEFGAGIYCKIDIEGNDDLCLQDMTEATKPQFVSIEAIGGNRQVQRLQELGYTRFKIISQRTLRQPNLRLTALKARMPAWARRLVVAGEARLMRYRADGAWHFAGGCSGPFGEETPGPWHSAKDALEVISLLERTAHLCDWYDIHAAC